MNQTTRLQHLIDCATRLKTAIDANQDEDALVFLGQFHQSLKMGDLRHELLVVRGEAERRLGRTPVRIDVYVLETEDWQPWVQILEETDGRILGQGVLGKYWNLFAAGSVDAIAKMEAIPGKGLTWWLNETPPNLEEDLEDDE